MGKYLGMKYNMSPEVHAILDKAKARLATVREQAEWVVGHVNAHEGNQSYEFPLRDRTDDLVYIIASDIELPPLYGAEALTLIVPPGIKVTHRALGDNRVLYMDGFGIDNDPGHDIMLGPALVNELSKKHHILAEDFVYAEAAMAGASPEHTLGLISEGHHAPGIFDDTDFTKRKR